MNTINSFKERLRRQLTTRVTKALGIWLLLCLIVSVIFLRGFWTSLPEILAPAKIANFNVAPWGVLVLCLIFLGFKWKDLKLKTDFTPRQRPVHWAVGAALVTAAVLIPFGPQLQVFKAGLVFLGAFVTVFGPGARIPAILLAIYGFSIAFPLLIDRYADDAYARLVTAPLMAIINALSYPVSQQGQAFVLTSTGGETMRFTISAECAGPTTMSVFIAIFILMMLDRPQTPRRAAGLFILGIFGTWLQNLVRLLILMVVGRNLGDDALWTAHYWTVYVLFPLWYILFAIIYFQVLKRPAAKKISTGHGPVPVEPRP